MLAGFPFITEIFGEFFYLDSPISFFICWKKNESSFFAFFMPKAGINLSFLRPATKTPNQPLCARGSSNSISSGGRPRVGRCSLRSSRAKR